MAAVPHLWIQKVQPPSPVLLKKIATNCGEANPPGSLWRQPVIATQNLVYNPTTSKLYAERDEMSNHFPLCLPQCCFQIGAAEAGSTGKSCQGR